MCSSKVSTQRKLNYSTISGIRCVGDLGTYLGFPLVKGRINRSLYNGIIERIQNRVTSWKGKLLNKAGRVCLAKSVASSIPTYIMQVRCLPKNVCSRIDGLTCNFVWGNNNSDHSWSLVNWHTVTSPKKFGGLGLRDTRLANFALLGKMVWSLLHEENKLWVQVIKQKYMTSNSVWLASRKANDSIIWRSICCVIEALRQGFALRMGNGSTSVWYSDWVGIGPLCQLVNFVNISDTNLQLKDLWDNGSWCLDRLATQLPTFVRDAIMHVPIPVNVHEGLADCWVWKGGSDGVYTVSSAYIIGS